MNDRIKIEINARDEFWRKAVFVEWEDQYPERRLQTEANSRYFLIEAAWLDDLKRIAGDCFSEALVTPADPSRRALLRRFIPGRTQNRVKDHRR